MAIAFEGSCSQTGDFVSSLTQTLNAGSNPDVLVLVWAITDRGSATTISSATWNGNAMTACTAMSSTLSGFDGRLFYLYSATGGSHSVQVTYSDGNTKPKFLAVAYSGVNSSTPIENQANFEYQNSSAPSQSVTSASGDLAVMIAAYTNRTAVAPTAPATENFDALLGSTTFYAYEWDSPGTGGSTTIAGTVSGGTAEIWGSMLSIKAAGGGAVSTKKILTLGVG